MDALNEIVRFLEQYHLKSVVDSIHEEMRTPKKAPTTEEYIKAALSDIARVPLKAEDQNVMAGLVKKLCLRPNPRALQDPPGLRDLKIYKKLLQPAVVQPVAESPLEESKVPATKMNPEPVPQQADISFQGQTIEDELFSASKIEHKQEPSSIFQHSNTSFGHLTMEEDAADEYDDDDDPGFIAYECTPDTFADNSREIADKHGFPDRAIAKQRNTDSKIWANKEDTVDRAVTNIVFPPSESERYPITIDNTVYDVFHLKVIYDREKTGFEETKDFQIVINSVIAGRYQVIEFLGSAAFSKAIQCLDLVTKEMVCLKIIENNKDYVDQSIDEIKLLRYINVNGDPDESHFLRLIDFFYHKEHLIIVTELLRDNLYEYSKYNREHEEDKYFTIGRLQKIAFQVLVSLNYLHSLHLVHCDLKPENILIKSYSRCEVKIIDLGSTCFIHDHLGSYVQSRSYRAPEVIMGCPYDYKIDIWSLGCIIAELYTGYVLFQNDTVQGLLSRVIGILGGITEEMFKTGRHTNSLFTKEKLPYQEIEQQRQLDNKHLNDEMIELINQHRKNAKKQTILVPKKTTLKARLHTNDAMFIDFIRTLLEVDKERRPTAAEALRHPFITECKYEDGLA